MRLFTELRQCQHPAVMPPHTLVLYKAPQAQTPGPAQAGAAGPWLMAGGVLGTSPLFSGALLLQKWGEDLLHSKVSELEK